MRALPPRRLVFFVDDNLYWRRDAFVALMRALIPLKMRWCCQITIDVARDDALLDLMAEAGCALALIGFESLDRESLVQMRKKWNGVAGGYDEVIAPLPRARHHDLRHFRVRLRRRHARKLRRALPRSRASSRCASRTSIR